MPKLIITRGLPGSGKSTRAKAWVAEDPVRRARVNRDDLRGMAHNGVHIKQSTDVAGTERAIMSVRDAAIASLLKRGVDVVCDDTNLPTRVARDLRRIAVRAGADFEVWDMTDVDPVTCTLRDSERARPVGEDVINDMHARFIRGKGHPLPLPEEAADSATEAVPYAHKPGLPEAIIVDIDGTVAHMVNRSPFDESRVHEDRPNWPVIEAVHAMEELGKKVVFMSGRTAGCRDATAEWLNNHFHPYELHMRAVGDTRKDSVVKRELFDKHVRDRYNVTHVFDDRNQVVEMWRSLGLTVLQVAEGDF